MKFGLEDTVLLQIVNICSKYPEIEEVIIYGSRAKGTYSTGSDIDLTFKGPKLNQTIINKVAHDFDESSIPYQFDLSIYEKIENPNLIDHINRVGKSVL